MKQTVPRDERLISFDCKDEREREKREQILSPHGMLRDLELSLNCLFSQRDFQNQSLKYIYSL